MDNFTFLIIIALACAFGYLINVMHRRREEQKQLRRDAIKRSKKQQKKMKRK